MDIKQSLCVVPARGGSKRFPGKNKAMIGGKPLIYHSIELACQNFTSVVFTSDCDELLDIANQNKMSNLWIDKRPSELSGDTSQVIDTVKHYYELRENDGFEQIWMLLPTCPLRTHANIVECKNLLLNEKFIVSVTDYDFPPSLSLDILPDRRIRSTCPSQPWELKNHRSQNHRKCYRPNGAIYGANWGAFRDNDFNFYGPDTIGYYMSKKRSIDIDTELDLKIAQSILEYDNLR